MIRGRHRGLPVAIDRAVMLPDLKSDDQRSARMRLSHGTASVGTYGGNVYPLHRMSTTPGSIHVPGNDVEDGIPSYDDQDNNNDRVTSSAFDERHGVGEEKAAAGLPV
jgi:hypothetical protein